jgi:glyoxylase-like metal-dependent hydrolase (beta-lactamase superfamily II)
VAAIRVETLAEKRHAAVDKGAVEKAWTEKDDHLVHQMSINPKANGLEKPFPKPFLSNKTITIPNVYWTGHHNEASFGATPYLLKANMNGEPTWIMVDTPKYSSAAVADVTSLTGPEGPAYLMLTHVDDTADHGKWAERFPSIKRIFHAGDLGRHNWLGDRTLEDVEILLQPRKEEAAGLTAFMLDGTVLNDDWRADFVSGALGSDVVVLHTPGHSPGSITLYFKGDEDANRPGVLFTGDTYGYTTRDGGRMTGFGRYGNNLRTQAETLSKMLELDWEVIAPGHGHPRDYRGDSFNARKEEMEGAIEDLALSARWR